MLNLKNHILPLPPSSQEEKHALQNARYLLIKCIFSPINVECTKYTRMSRCNQSGHSNTTTVVESILGPCCLQVEDMSLSKILKCNTKQVLKLCLSLPLFYQCEWVNTEGCYYQNYLKSIYSNPGPDPNKQLEKKLPTDIQETRGKEQRGVKCCS